MSTPLFSCYEALVAAMLREDFISASNARDLEEEVDDRVLGKLLTEQRSEGGLLYWPMHVGLQGLKGRPELNGCCCLALRVDLKTGRLAVRLADRTHISVKSANVDLEPTKLLNQLKQAVTAEASGEHVEMGLILEQLRERGWSEYMLNACHGLLDPDDNGKVVDNSPDGGPTLLAMAAMDLLPQSAAILLQAGASPNMLTKFDPRDTSLRITPLMVACNNSGPRHRPPCVREGEHVARSGSTIGALLAGNCDPNLACQWQTGQPPQSPLCSLLQRQSPLEIVQRLISGGAMVDPPLDGVEDEFLASPILVATECHPQALSLLCIAKANPNLVVEKDKDGYFPLFVATGHNSAQAVKIVLAAGANVNLSSCAGTPLMHAVEHDYGDIVELLIHAKANVNQRHKIETSSPAEIADSSHHEHFWLDGHTAILEAASHGHAKMINQLLAAGAKADACLDDGTSGLFLSAQAGSLPSVRALLGAAPGLIDKPRKNRVNKSSSTALAMACTGGHAAVVCFLIEAGASLDCRHTTCRPVVFAAEAEELHVLKLLLAAKASPNTTCDGRTPLYAATQCGGVQLVQVLLDAKADVNMEMYVPAATPGPMIRMHALSQAAQHGQLTILRMLIDARADLNVRNEPGATPLFLATECSHDKCALALIEAGADPNLGLHAGTRFSPDNPNDLGMHGNKPLHVAVYNNLQLVVSKLLEAGSEKDCLDSEGYSALTRAVVHGRAKLEIVELLLAHGASLHVPGQVANTGKDHAFASTLTYAASAESQFDDFAEIMELLLAHGPTDADVNYSLNVACEKGSEAIVRVLLRHGADVNQPMPGGGGWHPLWTASKLGHIDIVHQLLNAGARVNQAAAEGESPLFMACEYGHPQVVLVLIAAKAAVSQKSNDRATPLFMAMQNSPYNNNAVYLLPSPNKPQPKGQLKCVELLLRAGAPKEDAGMFRESVPTI